MSKKILIIDDEKMNIIALAHYLKPQYEIIIATDGQTGLEIAEKHIPDLILLDVVMPEMDGYDVIIKLKESESTKNIPVVFITGLNNDKDEKKGISLGAMGFIAKPFDKSVVETNVKKYIGV
jgi:CheY-like chemotaxis protein